MDYTKFKEGLKGALQERFPDGTTLTFHQVRLNNSEYFDSILISEEGSNLAIEINAERYFFRYGDRMPIPAIADRIVEEYRERLEGIGMDPALLNDFDQLKDRIVFSTGVVMSLLVPI